MAGRTVPNGWTVTARHDVLSNQQRQAVVSAAGYRSALAVAEANMLGRTADLHICGLSLKPFANGYQVTAVRCLAEAGRHHRDCRYQATV